MRKFTGNPIIKEYFEEFIKIRECSIAFVQYVDTGGNTCEFTDRMIDEVIDCVMKLKANRDYIYKYLGKAIPEYDIDGKRKNTIIHTYNWQTNIKALLL